MMPFPHNKQYINGDWKTGQSDKTIKNVNPYTGEEIGVIQSANEVDLDQAYQAAKEAQVEWLIRFLQKDGIGFINCYMY